MASRRPERRRAAGKGNFRKVAAALAVLVAVAVLLFVFFWVRSSDLLAVTRVIAPVTKHVSADQIRRLTQPANGVNLLRVSTRYIEERLRELPYVREAHVYRRFPDALEVRLVEYEPCARVQGRDGARWVVAETGRVLERATTKSQAALLLFVPEEKTWPEPGANLPATLVKALPVAPLLARSTVWPSGERIGLILVNKTGELTIVLHEGGEIRLGEPERLEEKLMVASTILNQYLRDKRTVSYIDVQVLSHVVAKAKEP